MTKPTRYATELVASDSAAEFILQLAALIKLIPESKRDKGNEHLDRIKVLLSFRAVPMRDEEGEDD